MALKKTIPSNYGIPAAYWRIFGVSVNDLENHFAIMLVGYPDEETRRAKNEDGTQKFQPIAPATVKLTPADIAALFPAGMQGGDWPLDKATLYEFIKTLPEYAGARDA